RAMGAARSRRHGPAGRGGRARSSRGRRLRSRPRACRARAPRGRTAASRSGAAGPAAKLPFDPAESEHGTHVAGIAAGDHGTTAPGPSGRPVQVSGIAPHAYLGNYRVLTIPTAQFGLDGNSPEIVAGIEAAVRDGMNVI